MTYNLGTRSKISYYRPKIKFFWRPMKIGQIIIPPQTTSVSPQRRGSSGVPTSSLWSRHRSTCKSALAAPARACGFQGCYHGISSAAWACPTITKPVGSCRRPSWQSPTSLIGIIPTACPVLPTVNCRSPVVSSCCSHQMKFSHFGCPITPVFRPIDPSAFEDLFPANPFVIYYYSLVLFYSSYIRFRGLWNSSSYRATYKNSDWQDTDIDSWTLHCTSQRTAKSRFTITLSSPKVNLEHSSM